MAGGSIHHTRPVLNGVLTLEEAGRCLTTLGKIWNLAGLPINQDNKHSSETDEERYVEEHQYLNLQARDMGLTDIRIIQHFVWLLSVDLTGNLLDSHLARPLSKMPNLVKLILDHNKFVDPHLPCIKHLQYFALAGNQVESLQRISHPNIEHLDLDHNRIEKVDPGECFNLATLKQLSMRGNLLATTAGLQYLNLTDLYLANNLIQKIEGLEVLINLERLHLRENPLADLTGFTIANTKLQYLNLRQCKVGDVEELTKLSSLVGLRVLVIKDNLFNEEQQEDDEEEVRVELLTVLPGLERIDKKAVSQDERNGADEMRNGQMTRRTEY